MARQRKRGVGGRGLAALAALMALLLAAGCGPAGSGSSGMSASAAQGGAQPAVAAAPAHGPVAAATPTDEPLSLALAPVWVPPNPPAPSATPRPTATPTVAMLVGPAVPWLTVQAYTSTPRPAYVAATPPAGPAVATIPPRTFPGSPAPTWTPAPTAFPVLPGQPPTATPEPRLELVSVADLVDAPTGEIVVTGEVRNISDRTLFGVRAVVNLYDAQGRLLGSASEALVFTSLKPDQRSPFVVAQTDREARSRYTVQFLDARGRLIETANTGS